MQTLFYDIYYDTLNSDGHLTGIITKRIDSVLNKPLFYKDKDGKVVEEMNDVIQSKEFRFIMHTIMETLLWGISGLEFIPGPDLQVREIPRKHIKTKTQKISFEQNDQNSGIDYTKLDNVFIIGEPEDLGLLLQCSQYVLYKRGAMSDWANFIEIFGQPIRVARYDAYDQQTKLEVKDALDNTGSALALLIPKTVDFEIMDGKTAASNGDLQGSYVKMLNDEMDITILGNTETTGNSKTGSQAKSKVHSAQQDEIIKSDIIYLTSWLNEPHFIRILESYGFPVVEGGEFEFNKDIDITFLSERALIDTALIKAGVKVGNKFMWETYNIPEPDADDVIVTQEPQVIEKTPQGTGAKPSAKPTDLADDDQQRPASIADVKALFKDFFAQAR